MQNEVQFWSYNQIAAATDQNFWSNNINIVYCDKEDHRSTARDSSVGLRLATGWTVRESNPGGGEIFLTRSDRSWGPPSLLYNGYWGYFSGVKRPGRGVNQPSPSSAKVKERAELYLCYHSGPLWSAQGRIYRTLLPKLRKEDGHTKR